MHILSDSTKNVYQTDTEMPEFMTILLYCALCTLVCFVLTRNYSIDNLFFTTTQHLLIHDGCPVHDAVSVMATGMVHI